MAITNAQQYKQLLAKGGRIGLKPGGPPGGGATSMGSGRDFSGPSGPAGGASAGGNYGGNRNPNQTYGAGDTNPGLETNIDRFAAAEANREIAKELARIEKKKEEEKRFKQSLENKKIREEKRKRAIQLKRLEEEDDLSFRDKLMLTPTVRTLDDNLVDVGAIGPQGMTIGGVKVPSLVTGAASAFKIDPSTKYFDEDSIREIGGRLSATQPKGITAIQADTLGDIREDITMRDNILDPNVKVSQSEFNEYINRNKQPTGNDNSDNQDPCKGPNPPAYCFVGIRSAEVAATPVEEKSPFEILNLRTRFADGGMPENPAVEGGIMDIESGRQMYFLGKLVKKATRAVKKIVKSPIGKAALFAAPFMFPGAREGIAKFLFKSPMAKGSGFGGFMEMLKGGMTGGGKFALGAGLTAAPFLFGNNDTEEDQPLYAGPDIDDPRIIMANYPKYLNLRNRFAEGGEAEPVAKKTMPLLDMDGKEMDLRADGGFVPIGRMERADDVPARLSKNEFVFTADAVRNAGEGDIDKGAEVMYNMMKNLESGGEVSEESQGLDGARDMFQTSQRLEEVL